jgi:arsenite methyltransferase
MTPRFIAQQLSCPAGLPGRIIGYLMNRRNAKMNAFAIRQLGVVPSDCILELGFGGGITLPHLIATGGFVVGLDRSQDVVRVANSKFSRAIANGRAAFHVGSVEALPFESSSFEKIITVNTVYFWNSLRQGFQEIHRVLAPRGLVVVGFLPKEWMDRMGLPGNIFTSRTLEEITEAMETAGLQRVRIEKPAASTAWVAVVGSG